ncbi:unnamed protein product, partial [Effrenium voratum]
GAVDSINFAGCRGLHTASQDAASDGGPVGTRELVSLLDGAKKVFAQRGPKELKSQVLLSALVTVATLPNLCRHSETWLFATAGWELLKRWAKLSQENKVQVGVAIHHSRSKGGHFFHTVAEPMISRCPELAQLHHGLARR